MNHSAAWHPLVERVGGAKAASMPPPGYSRTPYILLQAYRLITANHG